MNILAVTFGQVVAYVVNMIFAGFNDGWRIMFGFAVLPAVVQLVCKLLYPRKQQVFLNNNCSATVCT